MFLYNIDTFIFFSLFFCFLFFSVCEPHCDSEDNVQCVPTSFGDNDLADDNHNNHGVSQVIDIQI